MLLQLLEPALHAQGTHAHVRRTPSGRPLLKDQHAGACLGSRYGRAETRGSAAITMTSPVNSLIDTPPLYILLARATQCMVRAHITGGPLRRALSSLFRLPAVKDIFSTAAEDRPLP